MKRIALIVFVSLALCIALKAPLYAIDIGATGGWTGLVIGSSCLVGSAGSDLTSAYESWESATTINVTNTSGNNDAWRVKVRLDLGSSWQEGVKFYVKRTEDGSGGGTITNGSSYVEVTTFDAEFFNGSGDRLGVPIQYRLSGISISMPPGMYSAMVVFTVVDI